MRGANAVNDAVHQLDIARWLMGVEYPKSVYCTGGRFADEGAAEAPDTQIANFECNNLLMTLAHDALHAVHAEGIAADSHVAHRASLLAAEFHAGRDLRHRGLHGRDSPRRRLAGLRAAEAGNARV